MKKRFKSKRMATLGLAITLLLTPATTLGHGGRTDSNGGHRDNKNKSGLGYYHYHCGGHPAHLHKDGVCPYSSNASAKKTTTSSSKPKKSSASNKSSDIKKAQEKLNKLGYDCGKADGIMGKKTKAALKKFQKDKELKVDGILGPKSKKALGI